MKKILTAALAATASLLFTECSNQPAQPEAEAESVQTFQSISPKELSNNPVKMVADDWLLLTAKDGEKFNMMTASWGTFGNLWGEPVAFVFVRPQRHTFQFMEKDRYFTITVFEEQYRDILSFCGTKSGRDFDKVKETGLKPLFTDLGNVYYEQASVVIECEKIYADWFNEKAFIDPTISEKIYAQKDFHKMYIGKILNVWIKGEK